MRHAARGFLQAVLSLGLVGCANLDTADDVHDLRLLAIRLDAPDQVVPQAVLQRAPDGQSSSSIHLTALIADPNGAGRSIAYALYACARLDTTNRNCTPSSVGYQSMAAGQLAAADGDARLELDVLLPDTLVGQALAQDPYKGAQGIWLPLQLEIGAGQEHVVGVKLAVFGLPDTAGHYVPNQNPALQGMQVGDAVWAAETPFVFSLVSMPKDGFVLTPLFDAAAQEHYARLTFRGGTQRLQEAWLVDYFSTWGGLAPLTGGGTSPLAATPTNAASVFKPPKDAAFGPGRFWFVVRDGRGGESWLVRSAQLVP